MPVYNAGKNPYEDIIDKIPVVGKLINDYLIGRNPEDQIMALGLNVSPARRAGGEAKGVFSGLWDKMTRQRISDAPAKFKEPSDMMVGELGDLIDHPELFEYYPELRFRKAHVRIPDERSPFAAPTGSFSPGDESLRVLASTEEEAMASLLHEIQHWIQKKEGWMRGANADEFWKDVPAEILNEIHGDVIKNKQGNMVKLFGLDIPSKSPTELTRKLAYYLNPGEIEARGASQKFLDEILYQPTWKQATFDQIPKDKWVYPKGGQWKNP